MKIAWVMTNFDPSNPEKFPYGIAWYIIHHLENLGHEVRLIGDFSEPFLSFYKFKQLYYNLFSTKKYLRRRELKIFKHFAKLTDNALLNDNYDCILSFGSLPISMLQTDIPIFFWADATFDGLVNYYPEYSNLTKRTYKNGRYLEQSALDKCSLAFFSSEWARETALKYYNCNEDKLFVLPFGANIPETQSSIVNELINSKSFDTINFLFNGRDWSRKNGKQAVEIVKILNNRNIKSKLNVIGVDKIDGEDYENVIFHGFISKNSEYGRKRLDEIFRNNHFLLHLPLQDCTPHALNEANAYGIPCIVTNTGGISSIIKQNVNGMIYDLPLNTKKIAEDIIDIINGSDTYLKLAKSSYDKYRKHLNWEVNVKKLVEIIENKLEIK